MKSVDLNADVGEMPLGRERGIFAAVSSANVCCGFHAGDPETSRKALKEAGRRRLAVGAHPGYPDRAGKGRRPLDLSSGEIRNLVRHQIRELDLLASALGMRLAHAKPHGALYHQSLRDERVARAVAHGIESAELGLSVMAPAGSALQREARRLGLRVLREGFADRGLQGDGSLIPRGREGALLTDPAEAAAQALWLAGSGKVDTLCVHADTPGAVRIARAVRRHLEGAGFRVGR